MKKLVNRLKSKKFQSKLEKRKRLTGEEVREQRKEANYWLKKAIALKGMISLLPTDGKQNT